MPLNAAEEALADAAVDWDHVDRDRFAVTARAEALGVPATSIDGNDAANIDATAASLIADVRTGAWRPVVIRPMEPATETWPKEITLSTTATESVGSRA